MRKMKDSGVAWLSEIPENWQVVPPKALFRLRKDKAAPGDHQLTASQQHGIIYQDNYMALTGNRVVTVEKDFSILKRVEKGDFVISMRSFQGGLEYSENAGSISSAYVMLVPNLEYIVPEFYKWLFKSPTYITALQCTSNLIRDGQALRYNNFVQVPLCIIPKDEQKKIARTLGEKCQKIDALIANVQAQIEKLKAYKQSVVREAVTKGLKPHAPMKESGIEWIGQIPCDWKVLASKWLMRKTKTIREKYSGESVLSLTTKGVITRDLDNPSGKMPATFDGYQFVEAGNLLMCLFDIDVTPRCIGLIKNDGVCSPAYSQFKLNGLADAEYYYYYYLSLDYTKELLHLAKNLRHSLTEEQFGAIPTVLPPMETQKEIAAYLNKKCADIDRVLEIKQAKIEKLEQYKRSLIYEYVTGKKEVS
jgi:type I restriction enzyme S subunit